MNHFKIVKLLKLALILILTSVLHLSSLAQKTEIKGMLRNNIGYENIYISTFVQSENEIKSPISKSGNFNIELDIAEPDFYKIWLDDKNFVFLILSPNEKVTFNADASDIFNSFTISGSKHSELFYKANKEFSKFALEKDSLKEVFTAKVGLIEKKEQAFSLNYILKNMNSLTALMYVDRLDKEQHLNVIQALDSTLSIEYPTNKLVQDFSKEVKRMSFLSMGSNVPDILLKNSKGEEVALSSLKGKVVLIDFWATWCGPCKAEIPNLRTLYKKYKDKGFEIYAVSIDKQKNKWEEEERLLPWINVFDEEGTIARDFNVSSIPFTILIDSNGKIVGKNLRGSELFMKVSDMLD